MLCVLILYISGGTYSFIVDSERQIFWETFHGNFYLLSECLAEICWEEIAEEILFVFCFGYSNPDFSFNKSTHYLLEHGDHWPQTSQTQKWSWSVNRKVELSWSSFPKATGQDILKSKQQLSIETIRIGKSCK